MKISEHDHELWYGDPNKASKMTGKDFDKVYYNKLSALTLNQCTNLNCNFNIQNFKKYGEKDSEEIEFIKLIARSKNLVSLQLSENGLNKLDADMLSLALDPRRANFVSQVKILDLSKN